ncbi:MAG: ABC transporter permease [Chloroflexi bacterium HGW-Chloroflexi-1]|nr:MAG: ABC transporter permease [Chloroflexi bacterium HGW-Chloroflexi-1]
MNTDMVKALVVKDLTLFFRNRFFALITVLGLLAYIGIYYLMPNTVDELLAIGFYAPDLPPVITRQLADEGVVIQEMGSEEALKAAVVAGDFPTGIVLAADWTQKLATGERAQARIYFAADFPADLKESYVILLQELAFRISGRPLNIDAETEVLGVDRAGAQVPPRERMLPILAVLVLVMETMGLASLISAEIETGTLRALLVTPLRMEGLFLGKGLTGVVLAFVQVTLLMAITRGFMRNPLIMLVALFFGTVLTTGVSFLIAAVAKDLLSVIGWGILAMLVLMIPAFGVLVPGAVTDWVKVLPSHYLVDTVYQAANFDIGWQSVAGNLLILLASAAAFFGLGIVVLRRKFR